MSDFDELHAQLRQLMLGAAHGMIVAADEPGNLVLHMPEADPKTGKPLWFGAVTTKKSYVAYHLFPLYADPTLGDAISAGLTGRRQGKSCFNFKKPDKALFAELEALTKTCAR